LLDRVVFVCYLIVCHVNEDELNKFKNKNDGRRKFQIDLALSVIEYGIKLEWKEPYKKEDKPKWMRKQDYIPCGCKKCFFCKNGMTNGIDHIPKSKKEKKGKEMKRYVQQRGWILERLAVIVDHVIEHARTIQI